MKGLCDLSAAIMRRVAVVASSDVALIGRRPRTADDISLDVGDTSADNLMELKKH